MSYSIQLSRSERKTLLEIYRSNCRLSRHSHVLLLLNDQHSWRTVSDFLFISTSTIGRYLKDFQEHRLAFFRPTPTKDSACSCWWISYALIWLVQFTPRDFGSLRSRWTCSEIAYQLQIQHGLEVSRETVRRELKKADFVYRRPRPVIAKKDTAYPVRLGQIRNLLRNLPPDEVAFFMDEVDINTNPEIGSMWMEKGNQGEVLTPGDNQKRYLAGSLEWRHGKLVTTISDEKQGRNTVLFLEHLRELCRRYRRYKTIHVICDNAKFHKGTKVDEFLLKQDGRVIIHYLPRYSPKTNPIERVWFHLRNEITRNHRCFDMTELLYLVNDWVLERGEFQVEGAMYDDLQEKT